MMMERDISNDPKLCIANAEAAARWMQENAKVCRIGRGLKRQFFFRLAGDPRDDIDDATLVKEIKVFGGLPFASNGVV
jgi:hypothetical protein